MSNEQSIQSGERMHLNHRVTIEVKPPHRRLVWQGSQANFKHITDFPNLRTRHGSHLLVSTDGDACMIKDLTQTREGVKPRQSGVGASCVLLVAKPFVLGHAGRRLVVCDSGEARRIAADCSGR